MSWVAFRGSDQSPLQAKRSRENIDQNNLVSAKPHYRTSKVSPRRAHTQFDPCSLVDYAAEHFSEDQLETMRSELDRRGIVLSLKPPGASPFFCGFCHSNLTNPVVTECGHMFCRNCMAFWSQNSTHCPVCASEIDLRGTVSIRGPTQTNRIAPQPRPSAIDDYPRLVQVLVLVTLALLVVLVVK